MSSDSLLSIIINTVLRWNANLKENLIFSITDIMLYKRAMKQWSLCTIKEQLLEEAGCTAYKQNDKATVPE